MAYKTFVNGFPLNASELNNNFMNQVISTFADASARSTAIAAPVEGQITYLTGTNDYWKWDGSAWVELEALSPDFAATSSPNYIINGAFDVWQRGTSLSGTTADVYLADRWFVRNGTVPTTRVISQESFSPGDLEATGFGDATFYNRVTVTGTTSYIRFNQRIEDVATLAGQEVTVSLWARSSSATSMSTFLVQDFNGSADVTTALGGQTISSSWSRVSFTTTLPSITGKTIGAGNNLLLILQSGELTDGTVDIWGVQLEAGSAETPFKRNANSLQGELAACQRYYQKVGIGSAYPLGLGFATSTSNARVTIPLACNMRATPSVEDDSATIRHEGTNYAISTFASVVLGNGAMVTLNATTTVSSMTSNQLAVISADSNFALTSEL